MGQNRRDIQACQRLLNLIYPRRCPVCDEPTGRYDRLICTGCRERLSFVEEPACKKCGKPVLNERTEYCQDCQRRNHRFERGRAVLVYDRLMKASVTRFKYHNRREYADFYAQELYAGNARILAAWKPEVVIPVPLYGKKFRKRGFNQAELIARRLGRLAGLPVRGDLLIRTKDTRPQKELSDTERALNLKNAFQVRENDVDYKRVLLVDDIYTTGSTVDAASGALLASGVEKVYFLSVCIGRDY